MRISQYQYCLITVLGILTISGNCHGSELPPSESGRSIRVAAFMEQGLELSPLSKEQIEVLARHILINKDSANLKEEKVLGWRELRAGQDEVTIAVWFIGTKPHKINQVCFQFTENGFLYRADNNLKEFVGIPLELGYFSGPIRTKELNREVAPTTDK